tara:strand:+ start:123 stop:731 length:609 start_codon:yes stop_codon:yes gene_type:complete
MKKLLITFCAFALSITVANAQDYTPKSGDWGLSTDAGSMLTYVGNLFNGIAEGPEVNFSNGYSFHGKLFTDDMTAWRAGVGIGMISNNSETSDKSSSSFDLTLSAGREFRKGSSRLQGYYGYGAMVSMANSSYDDGDQTTSDVEDSSFEFGAHGFIGVEYFFKPKMSLGAEYMHGINFYSDDVESEFSINGGTAGLNLNFYF